MASATYDFPSDSLCERVRTRACLRAAWQRVDEAARRSASTTIREEARRFAADVDRHLSRIAVQLREGRAPLGGARGVAHERIGKRPRPLVIAPIESRIVQRALLDVLTSLPSIRAAFLATPTSFGGVPGRGVASAVSAALAAIGAGHVWYLRTDIAEFFRHIPRRVALDRLALHVKDARFLALLDQASHTELDNLAELGAHASLFPEDDTGVPQGSALSTLLGNVLLRDFDAQMNGRGIVCLRYVDDLLLLGESSAQVRKAFWSAQRALATLGLRAYDPATSPEKAAFGHSAGGVDFLGCELLSGRALPSRAKREELFARVDALLRRSEQFFTAPDARDATRFGLAPTLQAVSRTVEGFRASYRFCDAGHAFERLDRAIDGRIEKYLRLHRKHSAAELARAGHLAWALRVALSEQPTLGERREACYAKARDARRAHQRRLDRRFPAAATKARPSLLARRSGHGLGGDAGPPRRDDRAGSRLRRGLGVADGGLAPARGAALRHRGAGDLGRDLQAQHRRERPRRTRLARRGRSARALRREDAYPPCDLVTGTPPYLPQGTALLSPDPQRAAARIELRGGVEDYLRSLPACSRRGVARWSAPTAASPSACSAAPRSAGLAPLERLDVFAREGAKDPLLAVWTCARERPRPRALRPRAPRHARRRRRAHRGGRALRRHFGLTRRLSPGDEGTERATRGPHEAPVLLPQPAEEAFVPACPRASRPRRARRWPDPSRPAARPSASCATRAARASGSPVPLTAEEKCVVAEVVIAGRRAQLDADRAPLGPVIDTLARPLTMLVRARLRASHQEAARPRAKVSRAELPEHPFEPAERDDPTDVRPLDPGRAGATPGRPLRTARAGARSECGCAPRGARAGSWTSARRIASHARR
jgi:RNA-directed DNA polymerase